MNAKEELHGLGRSSSRWCACWKEVKGQRPIELLTVVYHVWNRMRKTPQAALRQLVVGEITQHGENQEACTVPLDVDSCMTQFHCLWWRDLGMQLEYPSVLPGHASLAYAGIRYLTASDSVFRKGIVVISGVAKGSAQAPTRQDSRCTPQVPPDHQNTAVGGRLGAANRSTAERGCGEGGSGGRGAEAG